MQGMTDEGDGRMGMTDEGDGCRGQLMKEMDAGDD